MIGPSWKPTCIYCGHELVRWPGHPSWRICPKCEPDLIGSPTTIDMRGAPSRPGPAKEGA